MLTPSMQPPSPPDPNPRPLLIRYDKYGEPFAIRSYHGSDRPALLAFYEAFQPKRAAQGLPPTGADRITRWLDGILGVGIHLLALRDGALIGHALLVPTGEEGVAEYAVFLRQDQRGHGVGTEFNRVAVTRAAADGLKRLWLTVEPHNRAAIRSYERVGFRFVPGTVFSPEAEMVMDL
ncbi:MAG TPA: GNAT family N-acetyltransferase [Longimicrobiaceae bacterium]|nr:GNAT family N-acetyltransferase [Longimicrobiaceae bacterium]